MDNLFGCLFIFGLSFALLVDCFESRTLMTTADNKKMQSITDHEDAYVKVMSHALAELKMKDQNMIEPYGELTDEDDDDVPNANVAAMVSETKEEYYYGAEAKFDVYNLPQVGGNQSSSTVMSLTNNLAMVSAGWHVAPELYGDHETRFFTLWSNRAHWTGCLNMNCSGPGFVLDQSSKLVPGSILYQKNITLKISKNQVTGDWILHSEDKAVGYWPKSLFKGAADNASKIMWGGFVFFSKGEKSPPMGSGHFPYSEGKEKAASISNINVISKNGELSAPKYDAPIEYDSNCYRVTTAGDVILYGGPGGCAK